MSGSKPTVAIRISAEGADSTRAKLEQVGATGEAAMRRVAAAAGSTTPAMQRLAGASDGLARSFSAMPGLMGDGARSIQGLTAGLAGAGGGFALAAAGAAAFGVAVVAGLTAGIRVAEEYERLGLRTAAVIKATEGAAGLSAAQIRALAVNIGDVTLASTTQVEAAAQKLLTFRSVAGDVFEKTMRLAQDLAAVGFGDISSAATQLGKALENPVEGLAGLTRIGITFSAAQKAVIKQLDDTGQTAAAQGVILEAVARQVGGAGAAEGGGLSGAYDDLGDNVEKFLERIGNAGPLQVATAAIRSLAAAVDGLNIAFDAGSKLFTGGTAVQASNTAIARAQSQVRAAETPDSYGQINQPALDAANAVFRDALAARTTIITAADQAQAEITAQAEAARSKTALEKATAAQVALELSLSGRLRAEQAYAAAVQTIDNSVREGVRTPEEAEDSRGIVRRQRDAAIFADLLARTKQGLVAVETLSAAETKAGDKAEKVAEKRQRVIDKLELQIAAEKAAIAAVTEGTTATRESAIALETEAKIREAGIPVIEKRTELEKQAAEQIGISVAALDKLQAAHKKADAEAAKTKAFQEKSWNELAGIGERAFDRLGDSLVDAFVSGQGAAVNFGNVARGIMASVMADIAKLAVVNPILNGLFTSSAGARPTLAGAFGGGTTSLGGAGLGDMLGLGNLLGGESIGSMLGLTGAGGLLGSTAIAGWSTSTNAALAAMGGVYGPATPGAVAAAGGGGLMGGAGATFGQLLGGAGAGFGAGMLLNSLLGGNQTSGMIGSGGGALAGALIGSIVPGIGTLIGGLIGGTAGGGLGGLIGPGESVRGYGLRLQSAGFAEGGSSGGGGFFGAGAGPSGPASNDFAGSLLPISRDFYNESGRAVFDAADQLVAGLNTYMAQRGLQVRGVSIVEGNKNQAGNLGAAFGGLSFAAGDQPDLNRTLAGRTFADPAALAQYVDGFFEIEAAIKSLNAEAVPQFTLALKAVNDNFDAATAQALKYGYAESELAGTRAKAIAELEAARTETLRQSGVSLAIRRMVAGGDTAQADLARQTEAAAAEIVSFGRALDALAITAEDKANRILDLERTQAAERLGIIARFGEQSAQALRQAGGNIRAYLDSLATGTAAGASPTDRLAAAQTAFNTDRTLSMGGDRDALGRVTGSADALLSAGRDMFASGPGFQSLVASVKAGLTALPVVQSYDAMQAASLSAIQTAIVNGTLNTATTILPAGNIVQIAGGISFGAVEAGLAAVVTVLAAVHASLYTIAGVTHGQLQALNASTVAGQHALNTSIVAGLGVVATNIATLAANDNAGFIATVAAQNAGNTLAVAASAAQVAAQNAGNTLAAAVSAAQIAAQNAGNTIAVSASAAQVASQNAGNTLAVAASAAQVAAQNAGNTLAVAISAAQVAAQNAGNTIAAAASVAQVATANASNTIAAGGYQASVASNNAGNTINATYYAQSMTQRQQMLVEMQQLRAQVTALTQAVQQAAILTATETAKGASLVRAGVDETTDQVRKMAA